VAARGSGRSQGAAAGRAFASHGHGGGTGGAITFYTAELRALLEGPAGPVAKDLVKRALKCQATAKRLCPVDTGRLRSSIAWRLETDARGLHAVVGTGVTYAAYVEFGTRYMRARPYLRPALMEATRA
jgi:hypothetical protein